MADRPTSRQELYERIRRSSKDEVVLEEMIRLGFWPAEGVLPSDPADEIRQRAELERQLAALHTELARLHNEAALRREMRRRRLLESRRKKQETKERHERERLARAEAWRERKSGEIGYLGEEVSGGLGHLEGDDERLRALGLPVVQTPPQIALAMGVTPGELRFLAFARKTSSITHYVRFQLPKKTGGTRLISAPLPRLKRAQRWILHHILEKLPPHEAAHGFRPGRSIMSNAVPHVRMDVVINIDLKDFFPTVGYRRVKGLFRSFGYSEAAATLFALICTEPAVEKVEIDGRTFYVARTERFLPQGAPTSPAITNLLCRRLDQLLTDRAGALGFTYTRYADDLTFSAKGEAGALAGAVLGMAAHTVEREGFRIHPDKTRVLRRGRRQEVTGIVVNSRPNVDRETLRRFRATLYQIEKDGPAGKRWGSSSDVLASIQGFASFVLMVNPEKGEGFRAQVERILEKYRPGGHHGGALPGVPPGVSDGQGGDAGAVAEAAGAASTASGAGASGDGSPTGGASGPDEGGPEKAGGKWWNLFKKR